MEESEKRSTIERKYGRKLLGGVRELLLQLRDMASVLLRRSYHYYVVCGLVDVPYKHVRCRAPPMYSADPVPAG
jgi:hypothetical protein